MVLFKLATDQPLLPRLRKVDYFDIKLLATSRLVYRRATITLGFAMLSSSIYFFITNIFKLKDYSLILDFFWFVRTMFIYVLRRPND